MAHAILDISNERSSHLMPTPRREGLAIVVCTLGDLIMVRVFLPVWSWPELLGFLTGALAHRSHLYQRLVISGYKHQAVTLHFGVDSLSHVLAQASVT